MISARILIIDDNRQILEALRILLKDEFGNIDTLSKPSRIPELLWKNDYDIVMLDMNFATGETSGNEGIFWLNEIRKRDPLLPVILITAYGDIELAVKGIQEGATDFISKPWDPEKLMITLKNAYRLRRSGKELSLVKNREKQLAGDLDRKHHMITGSSLQMQEVLNTVSRVAATDASVLLLGENGTGKEVIAREIHRRSARSTNIFLGVDMGSLSESLFESEMFGHVKGAFTDAREDRAGRFETANGGTLFLDEIGNIPLPMQSKLLQVIENREVVKVGDHRPISINIRLISATNRPLKQMVEEGTFREDLYYRLNTVSIVIPPLRERGEDIILLARNFLDEYSRKYLKSGLRFDQRTLSRLMDYPWPGNVRELKHCIERAVILCEGPKLGPVDLRLDESMDGRGSISLRLEEVEKATIIRAMKKCSGNHSRAAKVLDISRTTLYAKLKKYGL